MEVILGMRRSQSCASAKELGMSREWHDERRHYAEPRSHEYEYRPLKSYDIGPSEAEIRARDDRPRGLRSVPPPVRKPAPTQGARHFPGQARARSEEQAHMVPRKRVVLDAAGVPCRQRPAQQYDLEKAMGKKTPIRSVLARRNGIGFRRPGDKLYAAPEYSTGYYKNALYGGGVVPGSNFGFARATQTTKDSIKVFGKSLGELWARAPQLPKVLTMSLAYLELPQLAEQAEVFLNKAVVQEYIAGPESVHEDASDEDGGVPGSGGDGAADTGRRSVGSHFSHASKVSHMSRLSHASRLTLTRSLSRKTARPDWLPEDSPATQTREELAAARRGRWKQVCSLRGKFDADRSSVLDFERDETDPRVVFALLVQFLREMSPPLLTYDLFERLLSTQLEPSQPRRVEALRPTLALLPAPHEAALFALIRFLYLLQADRPDVATSRVLASIFAPLVLREDPLKPKSAIHKDEAVQQTLKEQVLVCMLDHVGEVFPASVLQPRRPPGSDIPSGLQRALLLSIDDVMDIGDLERWERQGLGSGRSVSTSAREEEEEEAKLAEAEQSAETAVGQQDCYDAELAQVLTAYASRHSTPAR